MKTKKRTGFTLIELLIVVAIIAILAAIAIPNFLAAQTRSKVARVKGNMRTSATALESYYVDNNSYPGCYRRGGGWNQNTFALPIVVTTPIAYITKVPDDIFDVFAGVGPGFIPIHYKIPGWSYRSASGTPDGPPVIDGDTPMHINTSTGNLIDDVVVTMRENNPTNVQYVVFSLGPGQQIAQSMFGTGFWDPDGQFSEPQPHRLWYDPTNGTVSIGYVVRESGGRVSP